MAESVKVIVRCRPMNAREYGLNCKEVINIDGKIGQCSIINPNDSKVPPKMFTFDGAYDTASTTEQIYADIGFPLVEGVTEGYNGTIFAYGQTGCGKSFSMQGITDPATQRGIIPRAFDHIFETIQVTENTKYLVHVSYLEIYNEEIRDLLGKDFKQRLDLKEHPDKGVYVKGLSMFACKSVKECDRIMAIGWQNRSTGATNMNAESSRSHSIFTIFLERCDQDDEGEEHIRAAKLNLVDLAGSERQAKTGATGDRLKEATKINLSLSALGNVISALVDGKSKHIPYRDSKLTRLLQDSLGGNTKTLMVACLSPADNNYDETLSTLRYANRAKNIKNKPKINEDPKDALLREYQEEINKLRAMLRGEIPIDIGGEVGAAVAAVTGKTVEKTVDDEEAVEKEKQRIRQEYDQQMAEMKQEYESMKITKEKLEEEMERLKRNYDDNIATVESEAHLQTLTSPGQQAARQQSAGSGPRSSEHVAIDEANREPNDMMNQDQPVAVVAPIISTDNRDIEQQDPISVTNDDQMKIAPVEGVATAAFTATVVTDVRIPVRKTDGEIVYMTGEEVTKGLPEGSELMTEDGENKLVPVTIPVQTSDGTVIQMSQQEVAEGLPPGAEVVSVTGMKDIPSPVVMLVVPEKIPVKQEDGEIVYMSQMEINEGIPAGAQVMKESNGELVPVQVVPVKTVEGKIEHKTQEEMTEGLAFGTEVMTTEAITTVTEGAAESSSPAEPEKVYAVQLEDGQIVHMSQQDVDQGLPAGADILAVEEKKSKDKVVVKTAEGSILTLSKSEVQQGLPPGMEVMSVHSNETGEVQEADDKELVQKQVIQHAVHLATVKTSGEDGAPDGPPTPSTSPAGEGVLTDKTFQQTEALRKLEKLQEKLVGGEQAKNEELKEKRRRKKRHAEERKRKLAAALANMEGEEIMLGIYDNIQDELKATTKLLKKEKDMNENLERDIKDLQAEFEFDRIDYLDTIRKQEQQVKWLEGVIDKIHPCLRRDCNYVNLDIVKAQSQWDEETSTWTLPKMTIDKIKLPSAGGVTLPSAGQDPQYSRGRNGENIYDDLKSEDRYYQKLSQKTGEDAKGYFKSNRQEKLLNQRNQVNGSLNSNKPLPNGKLAPGLAPWQMDPLSDDQLRAAQVHGQISQEEFPTRKPMRLDALPLGGGGPSTRKKGKKKVNTMEQY